MLTNSLHVVSMLDIYLSLLTVPGRLTQISASAI